MTERTNEAAVMLVGKEHAADRLLASQKLWRGSPYLGGAEPPSRQQVAAVLHALADHTLIENMLVRAPDLGADRVHLGDMFATATGVGRYLQIMGDWCEDILAPAHPDPEPPTGDGGREGVGS